MSKTELPIIAFVSEKDWETWLAKNHDKSEGIWVKFFKKNSGEQTITYAQALDGALCYGWIDSQLKSLDEKAYLQKFTPRRSKSIWSKRNIEHISRLTKEGRMQPAGIKQVEEAKKNGQWEMAYDSPSNMTVPDDFLKELEKDKKAREFFEGLNKANKYAIAWRLQTAKTPETRAKRMKTLLEMLSKEQKLH